MGEQPRDEAFHFAGDHLGKFVVLGELGRGSMGVVYEAFQEDLKRKVALKVLPANIALDIKQVRRFRREAESVARLQHPNVIQIYEVGQLENTHYFAMELVDGAPFGSQSFVRDRGYVDFAAKVARDAARGLAHAHEKGVIHRDIKPGNLLVDKAGRVVVTDFGLARLSESGSLTSTDAIVGTPKYMAPEQILPGTYPLDGRCDLYGLGATLYEAICGTPPIDAPTVQAFLKAILEERPIWPRKRNRLVPHDLSTIIMRCLEKHPDERYKCAEELADDLERFLNGERIQAKPKGLAKRSLSFLNRHRVVTALSGLFLVSGIATLTLLGALGDEREESNLRGEINMLLEDNDLAGLEALSDRFPGNTDVDSALAAMRQTRVNELLACQREELAAHIPEILSLFEKKGQQENFWRLMLLFEADGIEELRRLVAGAELPEHAARVVRARLALVDRDAEKARALLEEDPPEGTTPEAMVFHYLVQSRALRTMRQLEPALEVLGRARQASARLRQPWLQWRVDREFVDLEAIAKGSGRLETLRNLFRDVEDFTAAVLSNLARISEDLTSQEQQSVEEYIERVLAIADEKPDVSATELIERGQQRTRQGIQDENADEAVQGYLIQAIGHLASGRSLEAEESLDGADEFNVARMQPFVYWAYSLAARAQGRVSDALDFTQDAITFANDAEAQFSAADWKKLLRYASIIQLRATAEQRQSFLDEIGNALPTMQKAAWDFIISQVQGSRVQGSRGPDSR
ncbi:MAG: serine/threonine-protein kinase [Planctomycetota bacterium]